MEKYSSFRDAGTGIAPFLPLSPAPRTPLLLPLEFALLLIRIPVLAIVSAAYFILVELVGEILLRGTIPGALEWLKWTCLRSILCILGVLSIQETTDSQKRL
jgi:hypothetical protein